MFIQYNIYIIIIWERSYSDWTMISGNMANETVVHQPLLGFLVVVAVLFPLEEVELPAGAWVVAPSAAGVVKELGEAEELGREVSVPLAWVTVVWVTFLDWFCWDFSYWSRSP